MKEIFSKLSLYDILVMLIPGGTILVFIALSLDFELYFDTSKMAPALAWTITLTFAYLIGIVNHIVTSILWIGFRNNPCMISRAGVRKNVIGVETNNCGWLKCLILPIILLSILFIICLRVKRECVLYIDCIIYVLPLFYFLFLLLGIILFAIKSKCKKTTTECEIIKSFKRVRFFYKNEKSFSKIILEKYYERYYAALKNRYSNDIPVMEGQVAFMQSMIIPLSLLTLLPCEILCKYICGHVCEVRILVLSLVALLVLAIWHRQMKIYERVWEDARYLKLLQNKEDNSKNS